MALILFHKWQTKTTCRFENFAVCGTSILNLSSHLYLHSGNKCFFLPFWLIEYEFLLSWLCLKKPNPLDLISVKVYFSYKYKSQPKNMFRKCNPYKVCQSHFGLFFYLPPPFIKLILHNRCVPIFVSVKFCGEKENLHPLFDYNFVVCRCYQWVLHWLWYDKVHWKSSYFYRLYCILSNLFKLKIVQFKGDRWCFFIFFFPFLQSEQTVHPGGAA